MRRGGFDDACLSGELNDQTRAAAVQGVNDPAARCLIGAT
ncbi:hypothetical protein CHCC20335_0783 [Bacillus paralicheniformis]|nr:hypothetical protein CHCC20335_0783 [Bacillus paralicheniformis]